MADLITNTRSVTIDHSTDLYNHLKRIGVTFPSDIKEQNRLLKHASDSELSSPFENVCLNVKKKGGKFTVKLSVKHSAGNTMEETFDFSMKKGFNYRTHTQAKKSIFMLISHIEKQSLERVLIDNSRAQQDNENTGFGGFLNERLKK